MTETVMKNVVLGLLITRLEDTVTKLRGVEEKLGTQFALYPADDRTNHRAVNLTTAAHAINKICEAMQLVVDDLDEERTRHNAYHRTRKTSRFIADQAAARGLKEDLAILGVLDPEINDLPKTIEAMFQVVGEEGFDVHGFLTRRGFSPADLARMGLPK